MGDWMSDYEWNAEDYAANSAAQEKWALELIARLDLAPDADVLDLGCGDGKVTAAIASRFSGGSVTGIDSSSSMIELARERHPPARYPNLKFIHMDMREISLDERFDLAFSNAAMHWVKELHGVMNKVFSLLRPGGRILFQMGGEGNARHVVAILDEMIASSRWRRYFTDFDFPYNFPGREQAEEMLRAAGFGEMRVELFPREMEHDGTEGLKGWLRTTWLPYTQRLPASERDEFIDEIASRYLASHPPTAEGKVLVSMMRLQMEARRP